MSLKLSYPKPEGLEAKTAFTGSDIFLGDYQISMEDFLALTEYVLTNTDLAGDKDPRWRFITRIRASGIVPGWDSAQNSQCLRINVPRDL